MTERESFIEQMGMVMEASGLPRMAGRLLGALLVADPPERTAEALGQELQASRGAISTAAQLLEGAGMIQRLTLPGDRRYHYRTDPGGWAKTMEGMMGGLQATADVAERGLALLGDASPEVRRGLQEMRDLFQYWADAFPRVAAGYEEHKRLRATEMDGAPSSSKEGSP